MITLILMFIGFLFLILTYWKDKDILRIDLAVIQKFLVLMVLLTFFRLFIVSALSKFGIQFNFNDGVNLIEFWQLGLVFWEDAFFAIPIYWMVDRWNWSKYIWLPIVIILSIVFGLGHIYQFKAAFFMALILPYFVFYRYGKKFGFGTTMICHIVFDMVTFFTFKLFVFVAV